MRLLFSLLTAILIANALVGDRGLPANLRIRREHRELAAAIAALRATNQRLQLEAQRLRSDPAAIEELARRELGLVRPGERLFIVTDRRAPVAVEARPPPPADRVRRAAGRGLARIQSICYDKRTIRGEGCGRFNPTRRRIDRLTRGGAVR